MPFQPSPRSGPSEMRPRVGFRPNTPQHDAGMRIEPPPSVAWATGSIPAATAAAAPPLDPPALRPISQGLRTGPNSAGSVLGLRPSSGVLDLAKHTSPADRKRRTISESSDATSSANRRLPFDVATPATRVHRSFMTNGTPRKGPDGRPSSIAWRARDSKRFTMALTDG